MFPTVIAMLCAQNNDIRSHFTLSSDLLRISKGTVHFTSIGVGVSMQ